MKTNDKSVKGIAKAAYPDYAGRKFFVEAQQFPLDMRSYWDGGSREYYRFVSLADGRVSDAVPAQSGYDRTVSGLDAVTVPVGFVAVRHAFHCGIDCGLTVIAHPNNVAPLLFNGARA